MPDSQFILAAVTVSSQYFNKLARAVMGIMLLFLVIFWSFGSGWLMYHTLNFSTSSMELPQGATVWIAGCSLVWALASSLWATVVWKNLASGTLSLRFIWVIVLMGMLMGVPYPLLWPALSRWGSTASPILLLAAGVAYLMLGAIMWRLDRSAWPTKWLAAVEKLIQGLSRQLVSGH